MHEGEELIMTMVSVDQGQALPIYVIVALALLVTAGIRARTSKEWGALGACLAFMGVVLFASVALNDDPELPPSLSLTGFSCLYAGWLVGTKFDPLNPLVAIGGANKEADEYPTKDETVGILGRRGVDAWPGLLLGVLLSLLAIVLVDFQ